MNVGECLMPLDQPYKVAVLLAAYNGMQWIDEQVKSILEQSAVDVTLYISVDPSTDGTEIWCSTLSDAHPNVVVLAEAGRFGGAAPNFFRLIRDVEFADYDFVALADQDDIWHPDKLWRAVQTLSSTDYDAYSSNVTAFWQDGRTHLLDKAQPQVAWDFLFEAAGPGCTYVLSRRLADPLKDSIVSRWKAFQGVSLHDWYFYAFARSQNFKWFIDPVPSMQYRQHENNQVGANTSLFSLMVRYKTIHEGWWFKQVRMITCLVGRGDDHFVSTWLPLERIHLLRLSLHSWQCRRRFRDKLFFFFICLTSALIGSKTK